MNDIILPYPQLKKFATEIFLKIGCPKEQAIKAVDLR